MFVREKKNRIISVNRDPLTVTLWEEGLHIPLMLVLLMSAIKHIHLNMYSLLSVLILLFSICLQNKYTV